ncbi:MAG TPA: rhomboid family intramembrane serine protease [Candidatus Binatia bacterium]|jgi:membrane associated rhomboid family serine protease|nr:rhomboid family intramembrane serine protease [Candidatus Binatia bacterium]
MYPPIGLCNGLILVITGLVSFLGFSSRRIEDKYIFHPESILAGKEYYRLLTSGFLHADWRHLLLNMMSLYFFGGRVEWELGHSNFLLVYLGAIVGGNLLSLYIHRHHEYLAYGASGGVCGIIFAYILLFPGSRISLMFIPVFVPGWLYAIGFMSLSFFAMRAGRDNVGHDAHLGGAMVGLLIAAGLRPEMVRENLSVFLIVLTSAGVLLAYLWINPLPLENFSFTGWWKRNRGASVVKPRRENLEVDRILEKLAKSGIGSLSAEEKGLLEEVSGKYQRRAESKKPESGLAI